MRIWVGMCLCIAGSGYAAEVPACSAVPLATAILAQNPIGHDAVITQHEWQELKIDSLITALDRTSTCFGRWGLQEITWPLADMRRIEQRQQLLKLLVTDTAFYTQAQALLQRLAHDQDALLAYWQEHDAVSQAVASLYFSPKGSWFSSFAKWANTSSVALECTTALSGIMRFYALAAVLFANGIFQETYEQGGDFTLLRALKKAFAYPLTINSPVPNIFTKEVLESSLEQQRGLMLSKCILSLGDWYYMFSHGSQRKIAAAAGAGFMISGADFFLYMQMREAICSVRELLTALDALQKRMVAVARFIQTAHALCQLFEQKMGNAGDTFLMTKDAPSAERLSLEKLLQAGTFLQEKITVYSRGRVLRAHKCMQDVKEAFIPLLQGVGQLDAYCGLARLYIEGAGTAHAFNFAQFTPAAHAQCTVTDCWIPLYIDRSSVRNSIEWGTQAHPEHIIIITGPNGCGKSTLMKEIAWVALLAQAWGIVPAQQALLSVFGCIKTSINPQENLHEGISTFMAEKQRMDEIELFLRNWSHKQPVLLILDEPYHGTVGLEAAERVMHYAMRQTDKQWCQLIMATHLEPVTHLEEQLPTVFANYCFDAELDSEGIFKRTFVLQRGITHWWFADQDKRRRFIDQLGGE